MGTAEIHQVRFAALAPIQGEGLAHDHDWHGPAGLEIIRNVDRVPEPAHEAPGQGARAGGLPLADFIRTGM